MRWLVILLILGAPRAMAQVEIPVSEYDFGTVISGTVVQADFEVVNRTGDMIFVEPHVSACPCLEAETTPVAAGERQSLSVRLDTTGRQGFLRTYVRLNVPSHAEPVRLNLAGRVLPPYRWSPRVLQISRIKASATLEIRGPVPFRILDCLAEPHIRFVSRCSRETADRIHDVTLSSRGVTDEITKGVLTLEIIAEPGRTVLEVPIVYAPDP